MKIYFSLSLSQNNNNRTIAIERLLNGLVRLRHQVNPCDILLKMKSPKQYLYQSRIEALEKQKKLTEQKMLSDICIFEATYKSFGIGQEIAIALKSEKPVIVLYDSSFPKPHILSDLSDDSLFVLPYRIDNILEETLQVIDYLTYAKTYKFNFMISTKINRYLNWVSEQKKMPKAAYIRQLIHEKMSLDTRFSQE